MEPARSQASIHQKSFIMFYAIQLLMINGNLLVSKIDRMGCVKFKKWSKLD